MEPSDTNIGMTDMFSRAVHPHHYFRLVNGQIIKNVNELPEALINIDDSVFKNHVTQSKNDFSRWLYDVFRLEDLSRRLAEIKSKDETIRIIMAYLKQARYFNRLSISPDHTKIPINSPEKTAYNASGNRNFELHNAVTDQSGQENTNASQQNSKAQSQAAQPGQAAVNPVQDIKPGTAPDKMPDKAAPSAKNQESPDKYFEENPMLMSQRIDAKKKTVKFDALIPLGITGAESPKALIELFKDAYSRAYQRTSELRKIGYYTSLAEIMIFRIPPKIRIYEISQEKKDESVVLRYLNEIIEELNNMSVYKVK